MITHATLNVNLGKNDTISAYPGVDCFPASISPALPPSAFLTSDPTLLAEVQTMFQALLDLACTYHLIKERMLFWTYHLDMSLEITTASSGMLTTKAQGLVKLEVKIHSDSTLTKKVVLSLHNCLHALKVAMNLLSIGAFIKSHLPILFDLDGFTRVHFPSSIVSLVRKHFRATIHRQLVFLKCRFLPPPQLILPALALASFTPQEPDYGLWHEWLAHLGIESIKDLLNGLYAEGVLWN